MLQATFHYSYSTVNKNGEDTLVRVYKVTGTPEELLAFEQAQGEHFRRDDKTGQPIWHNNVYYGEQIGLIILPANAKYPKPKVIADLEPMRKAISLANVYGPVIGKAIADKIAEQLLAPTIAPPQPKHVQHAEPEPGMDEG